MTANAQEGLDDSQRLKELGHLSAAVGHHVINAFSAVVSNAELIRSHARDASCNLDELVALATGIIENALAGSHVPRRLIDWTRRVTSADLEQPGAPAAILDPNEWIREAVASQPADRIDWILDLNPVPLIRGNAPQLGLLLGYLFENARDAMSGRAGAIAISTRVDARSWVIVEIRDSGCGMSEEVLKRATEPFFSTKPGRGGTGLTIAHGIWRRHRGALSLESRPGEGTTVRLAVEPASPAAAADSAAASE
jgi:signal transduction histidine kinase